MSRIPVIPGAMRSIEPGMTALNQPDRLLLVFCTILPWSPCSRMLCFSSSRWPLVVSIGTFGALPGPLWLWLSSGTGVMFFSSGFVIGFSIASREKRGTSRTRSGGITSPVGSRRIAGGRRDQFAAIPSIMCSLPANNHEVRPPS